MSESDQRAESYEDTPSGWQRRWQMELKAARQNTEKWRKGASKIVDRYLGVRDTELAKEETRWNLFTADVQTDMAILYGQTPKVDVSRRFADQEDDAARVGGELLERILNTDIERAEDGYCSALEHALEDRMLAGFGFARCRYVSETETAEDTPAITKEGPDGEPVEMAPAVAGQERVASEDVEVVYEHWRNVLWGPARTWEDVPWVAFAAELSPEQLTKRFGETIAAAVPLNASKQGSPEDEGDAQRSDPWARAVVWEIWSKEHRRTWWVVEGMGAVLGSEEDIYGLAGFWPFPRPLVATTTTSAFLPRPDYALLEDLYREVDSISTRITRLEKAVKVVGVYDQNAKGVERMLSEATDNQLIPVDNWAVFAEKGGIKGQVDWLPLEQIVAALDKLREVRSELIAAIRQISGKSDAVRGQGMSGGQPVTATERRIEAQAASIRTQKMQDEFARFASDLQRIRAEMVSKLFQPETIKQRSNAAYLTKEDQQHMDAAVALIKSDRFAHYRIQVKPEEVAAQDFGALKSESLEVLSAVTSFIQAAMPAAQAMPGSMPFLLELLQWSISRIRGGKTIEGVIDAAIQQAKQAAQQPQGQAAPDPKLLAAQAKSQADQQKAQLDMQRETQKHQFDLERIQAEVAAEQQKQAMQTRYNLMEDAGRARIKHATEPAPMSGPSGGGVP